MRIRLTKKYAIHVKELPKGTELKCTNELGRELIEKGVAVEINHATKEEIATVDRLIDDLEDFDKKKHTKKTKKEKPLKNESNGD